MKNRLLKGLPESKWICPGNSNIRHGKNLVNHGVQVSEVEQDLVESHSGKKITNKRLFLVTLRRIYYDLSE